MANIFIADDHPIILEGLKDFLEGLNHTIVGSAINGNAALDFIVENQPDIAILDLNMPYISGLEIAEICFNTNLSSKIILTTFRKELDFYLQAQKYNVFGYLLKDFQLKEIEDCINSVVNGTPYFSKEIIKRFGSNKQFELDFSCLTKSESNILKLMARHLSSIEISNVLPISVRTVEKHKSNIIQKLNLESKPRSLNMWVEKNKHFFTQ